MLKNRRGFSLIEIMIVLAIIGLIGALMANRMTGAFDKAKVKQAKAMIQQLMSQLEMYNQDCNTYPTTDQGLAALTKQPVGEPACENWGPKPYLKNVPKDPWGVEYKYDSDGNEFKIYSYGKNKREGGDGLDKDITSEEL